MKHYVNLHTHTSFSMLDGHGRVEAYAKRVKDLQMGALAQTDHGNIHGWLDFYDACREQDVKPIFGIEAYQARKTRFDRDQEERSGPATKEWEQRGPYHLTILAQNKAGYDNIIKISSRSYLEGFYGKGRIDHDLLSEHAEGLIVLSGCLNGEVPQALLRGDFEGALEKATTMQDIIGKDNYFIEVHDHGIAEQLQIKSDLIRIAKMINAPIVPTGDCHYVHKEDHGKHDIMLCVGTGSTVHNENRFKFAGPEFFLKSYDEMVTRFEPEWLENSVRIADMTEVELNFGEYYFPESQDVPEGEDVDVYLERLMWEGLEKLYPTPLPQEVIDRALYEFRVIQREGFQHYFLVVSDIVQWAKDNGISVGPGRGSAAGCMLSYALGITKLDPIMYDLLFERFLIEGRKTVPDIDLDFDDRFREKVIEYCVEKYGADHVAHIITYSSIKAASAIRDSARALGHEYQVGDKLAKMIPPPVLGATKTLKECMDIKEFKETYENDTASREVLDAAVGLEGLYRQTGIHAAGIVVSKNPMIEYVPVIKTGDDKPIVTQWDMNRVEQCGLLKIDFLGLRNLGVIDLCIDRIKKRHDIDLDIDTIPLDDEEVYELLQSGQSVGCFQIEGSGMRQMMMELCPENIYDIMALISLYRPGPMGSGMDKMYIDRKHGREKIVYYHESLNEVLEKSKGIMLYQEDVLNVAKKAAGLSGAEADDLRRAIGKKYMDKISEYRKIFVEGAKKTNDIPEGLANQIYSDIEFFAGYGFNRAHGAAYSIISYQTAYLKKKYPVEYMAALMSTVVNNKDKLNLYLGECKAMGIEVLPPSIVDSEYHFTVKDDNTIRFGLSGIDGLGEAQIGYLEENRDHHESVWSFMRNSNPNALNKKTILQLVNSGSLDDLVREKDSKLGHLTREETVDILNRENSAIGIYLSGHPLDDLWHVLEGDVSHTCEELASLPDGTGVNVAGILLNYEQLTTKRSGQKMCKFVVEDLSGKAAAIVFPNDFNRTMEKLDPKTKPICQIKGNIKRESENSDITLVIRDINPIEDTLLIGGKPIVLPINNSIDMLQIEKISEIIDKNRGDCPLYLQIHDKEFDIVFRFNNCIREDAVDVIKDIITLTEVRHLV